MERISFDGKSEPLVFDGSTYLALSTVLKRREYHVLCFSAGPDLRDTEILRSVRGSLRLLGCGIIALFGSANGTAGPAEDVKSFAARTGLLAFVDVHDATRQAFHADDEHPPALVVSSTGDVVLSQRSGESLASFLERAKAFVADDYTLSSSRARLTPPSPVALAPKPWWQRCFGRGRKRKMTPEERLQLTWWTKWRAFGRTPWKLIVHLLLAMASSALIVIYVVTDVPYRTNNLATFHRSFLPPSLAPDDSAAHNYQVRHVYSVSETLDAISYAVTAYFSFIDDSLDRFEYVRDANGTVQPVTLSVDQYKQGLAVFAGDTDTSTYTRVYHVRQTDPPLGPLNLNGSALRGFFDVTTGIVLQFSVLGQEVSTSGGLMLPYRWDITMTFDLECGGRGQLNLDSTISLAHVVNPGRLFLVKCVWLDLVVILLSIVSLVLQAKALAKVYNSSKKLYAERRSAPDGGPGTRRPIVTTIFALFSLSHLVAIGSDVCNIIGWSMDAAIKFGTLSPGLFPSVMQGLGCALAWLGMLRYFNSFPRFYLLLTALGNGLPSVGVLLVSVIPIILAYALFGLAVFAELTNDFASFDHSFSSLFSTVNGDSLYQRYTSIAESSDYMIIARIFEVSLVCVGAYAVLNVFIAIIQDSYSRSKQDIAAQNAPPAASCTSDRLSSGSVASTVELNEVVSPQPIRAPAAVLERTGPASTLDVVLKALSETKAELAALETRSCLARRHLETLEQQLLPQSPSSSLFPPH